MSVVESHEHAGLRITLHYDDSGCGDPREWDNLSHLYCWHPDYVLGDEQFTEQDFDSIEDVYRHVKRERKATLILPLFLYDHSGITISAGEVIEKLTPANVDTRNRSPFDGHGWDTSWVGFAYATEKRRKLLGVPRSRAKVEEAIRMEVKEYDKFLRGEVYGYVIEDEYGLRLDDLWGMLGYSYAMERANEAAEDCAQDVIARELNRLPVAT